MPVLFETQDAPQGLIVDQPYYKWLQDNVGRGDVNKLHTKLKYLKSLGFELGRHRLATVNHETLRAIEWVYFHSTKSSYLSTIKNT